MIWVPPIAMESPRQGHNEVAPRVGRCGALARQAHQTGPVRSPLNEIAPRSGLHGVTNGLSLLKPPSEPSIAGGFFEELGKIHRTTKNPAKAGFGV
jgi:hypothetical protein